MFFVFKFYSCFTIHCDVRGNKQWCKFIAKRPVIEIFHNANNRTFYPVTPYAYFFIQYFIRVFYSQTFHKRLIH